MESLLSVSESNYACALKPAIRVLYVDEFLSYGVKKG